MSDFKDLFLKCHDASVFAEKNNHTVLSKVFFDDRHTSQILGQDQYFLVGEKGTGKTMIAQYLSNIRTDINASLLDFSKIDFETFRKLSDEGHLKFIQADQLWKVLLIVIAAEIVFKNESTILGFPKFGELKKIIDEFYDNRFNPEFPVVIQLIEKFDKLSKLANQYIGEDGASEGVEESIIVNEASSPLNSILRKFENSFLRSRVSSDHIIFIDRIDIKPDNIEFEKFILGLRAFARAVLSLNEEVFSKMKGRKRIKFVLLVRPDIFDRLNLQNQSARLRTY